MMCKFYKRANGYFTNLAILSILIAIFIFIGGVLFIIIALFTNNTQIVDQYDIQRYIFLFLSLIIFYLIFYDEAEKLINEELKKSNNTKLN